MKQSLLDKLETLCARHEEIAGLLSDIEVINDQDRFRNLSMEYAQLEDVVKHFNAYREAQQALESAREMLDENDAEMRELAEEEIAENSVRIESLETELQKLLLPKDPNDSANVFLEIRAGTGGDEAAIFAGDLFRMYSRFAESRGWQLEVLNSSEGEHGGYKEIIARIIGNGAYSQLKFESGAHRVQRVPETESQGRVHTSAATVAIIPESEEVQLIKINPADLRIDTFRASGAGGQHVNKTSSAVRLRHVPSGVTVSCQQERSQFKNRATAMRMLKAALYQLAIDEQEKKRAAVEATKTDISWGNQIRSYIFQPYTMVNDHRTERKVTNVQSVMDGDIDSFIEAYLKKFGSRAA